MKIQKSGFTLIELLLVIAIIGILASGVLAAIGQSKEKARDAKKISGMKDIQVALELFYDQFHAYPTTTPAGYVGSDAALQMLFAEGYLKSDTSLSGIAHYYHGGEEDTSPYTDCTVGACRGYSLSVLLERSDNAALASDADAQVRDQFAIPVFEGASSDCGAAVSLPELCFDLIEQ